MNEYNATSKSTKLIKNQNRFTISVISLGIIIAIVLVSILSSHTSQKKNLSEAVTITPTPTPIIDEYDFKKTSFSTTVEQVNNEGNKYKGDRITFDGEIDNFALGTDGKTAGANVSDPYNQSDLSVVQLAFPSGTNTTKLSNNDTLTIWGYDEGSFPGRSNDGTTINETLIQVVYMNDLTSNYVFDGE